MEKQISIIIPTYNMEAYIGKCLDSLLIPELDRVEVIVVNDGSKDRSSEIAHSYADRYPASIRVIDKENGNYGSCINVALPRCTGRYVKVLDADDTFDTVAFSNYVNALSERDEDVLINDYIKVYEDASEEFPQRSFLSFGLVSKKSYTFDDVFQYICADLHMHYVAYKRANILSMNYRQTEGISYTDNEWVYSPVCLANTFAFIDSGYLYRYLLGRAGQTVDPSLSLSRINDHIEVLKTQSCFYEKNVVNGSRKAYLTNQLRGHIDLIYRMVLESGNSSRMAQLAEFDSMLKLQCHSVYELAENILYAPRLPYKFIRAFRNSGYSSKFKINRLIKVLERMMFLAAKTKHAIKRSL